jgi:hypothetical protein
MDSHRRAALEEQRNNTRLERERQDQLRGLEDLKAALLAAGEAFEIFYRAETPSWTPTWIPWGYSYIPWALVTPAEETWFEDDLDARDEAFVSALSRCAGPHDSVLFVFEGRGASFRMARDAGVRNVGVILARVASGSPLWVTCPPKQWLIEVTRENVRVGDSLPEAGAGAEAAGQTGRAVFDRLLKELDAWGTSYLAFNTDDPGAPDLPQIRQERPIPALRTAVPADDRQSVLAIVRGFLEERVAPEAPIQLIWTGARRIQLARKDFNRHIETAVAPATDINLSAPGAEWVIRIRPRTLIWIEGVG